MKDLPNRTDAFQASVSFLKALQSLIENKSSAGKLPQSHHSFRIISANSCERYFKIVVACGVVWWYIINIAKQIARS